MKLLLLFAVLVYYVQALNEGGQNITIAVVEYHPIQNSSLKSKEKVLANTHQYVELIKAVNDFKLDMIIFPEATLRDNPETAVEIKINDNPCDSPVSEVLQQLSCAARNFTTYLVINLVEKEKCNGTNSSKNCQENGFFFYNTDVAFDRNGTIINRYRKYNLFGEYELDKPSFAEEVIIKTDFGKNYGIFTCFDILFKSPAQDLIEKNIDAAIFPTMWFSELPFLTALQAQQMWAQVHKVKLFAAGANNLAVGSGGSGFYNGDQGMVLGGIVASGDSHTFVYKYTTGESSIDLNLQKEEDIDVLSKQMDGFYLKTDSSIEEYNSIVLDTSTNNVSTSFCYKNGTENKLCCHFDVKIKVNTTTTDKKSYTYHLVAFSGVRSFSGVYNGGIELCAIIACLNSSLSSCGQRFSNYSDIYWPITFEELTIKSKFEKNENKTQYPNSLLSSIRPISANKTIWEEKEIPEENVIERSFSLKEPQNRLLSFAIYGRKFAEDYPPDDKDNDDSSATLLTAYLTIFGVVLTIFMQWNL